MPWPRRTPTRCTTRACRARSVAAGSRGAAAGPSATLHVHGGGRLREPAGELRELLGRLPFRQLAEQRPADRRPQGFVTTETGTYTLNGYNGTYGQNIQRNPGATWAVTSEDEWYKAAYYKGGSTNAGYWDYPTRSNTAPGQDMADASGNNANYYTAPAPTPSTTGKYTTVVGEFQNSPSPYGTFDQGGNVWEWNEAIIYQDSDCVLRDVRGGSFDFTRRPAGRGPPRLLRQLPDERELRYRVPCLRGS